MPRIALIVTILTICLCLQLPTDTYAARILGFFPSPSKSHFYIHCTIADELQQAGHNVTIIASMPNVIEQAKYEYIQLDIPTYDDTFAQKLIKQGGKSNKPLHFNFLNVLKNTAIWANATLALDAMQEFLHTHGPNSYDLLLLGYFNNDVHLGLGAHFQCPIVLSFTVQSFFETDVMIANPSEVAYVPSLFMRLQQPMNFFDRLKNIFSYILEHFHLLRILNNLNEKFYDEHFPADRYPSLDEMKKNVSLVFVNHHFSQGPIRPQVPAMVEIGGIQIKEKPDPLPENIQQVLDNAKNGAIYFSLGSNVQGAILSPEKAKIMFNVLSKLPYKVLWKWGDSDFPGTSKNILYQSWLPQDDILAHPNVKLFITHGGQGSVVESQYHGVPMVGIPLFGDQPANMANVERSGFGLPVSYIDLTEESFSKAISEVLNNPKYSEAVKTFSRIYRDRPMTARQTAVYWVEYVLRHHGAKHLQSPAVFMNKWQLMSLDVIAFIVVVLTLVISIIVVICKLICCRGRKATKKVTKAKKNK